MRKKYTILRALTLLLIAVLVVSGCGFTGDSSNGNSNTNTNTSEPSASNGNSGGSDSSNPSETKKQVFNMVASAEIPTMDSALAHDSIAFTVLNNVNEGLYRLGKDHNPILGVAESHEPSADGLVHTFKIRDNAKWSNGEPVTANDFEYAWKSVFKKAGVYNSMFETAGVLNAAEIIKGEKDPEELGVKAIDEKTLQVTLVAPNPLFSSLLTFPTFLPQNQKFVESQGDKYGLEYNTVLYNGPFVLSDWKHEQSWQYKKNPDYWNAAEVKLDEINVHVVKETSTEVNLFETKKVDRITLSSEYVDQYRSSPDFKNPVQFGIVFLRFNHQHPVLSNDKIRRAVNMAIDKQSLTDVILNNGARPLNGIVPYEFSYSPDGKDFRTIGGDYNTGTVEEAQALFAQGLQEAGVSSLDVTLTVSDSEVHMKTAEYLKAQIEEKLPGFTVKIGAVPFQERLTREKALDYEMVISTWGPDYNDPMTYVDMWVTGGSANRMGYSDEAFDNLVNSAKKETDIAKRYQQMIDAEKILLGEDAALVPLFQNGLAILQRPSVKGLVQHPSGPDFTFIWTSIEE